MLPTRSRMVLAVLFTGAFVMGSAEMLVVGLIDLIAADLDVSLAQAGALVTANAIGLAIGGPALTFLTARTDRRTLLLGALVAFAALSLLPVLGAGYGPVLAARVAIGAVQGLFIAAGITTATTVVPPERAGRAMAVVISGFASASAFGLPLGTLLGQAVGWRGAFAAILAAGLLVLVAAVPLLPRVPTADDTTSRPFAQARYAFAPPVLAVLAVGAVMFVGIQSALTYLVPFLTDSGVAAPVVSAFLLAYGVATTLGSAAGGRFADTGAGRTMVVGTAGVVVSLLVLGLLGGNPVLATVGVLGIGLCGMGIAPSLQHRVVTLAGPGAALASSLPSSAVNLGIALGATLGGVATTHGPAAPALAGAVVAVGAVVLAWWTAPLRPRVAAVAPTADAPTSDAPAADLDTRTPADTRGES